MSYCRGNATTEKNFIFAVITQEKKGEWLELGR